MSVLRTCPECGYTGRYTSAALADVHHRRHSCPRHQAEAARTRRRTERARNRVRHECAHPRASHVHGTRAAYVKDRCRCPDCTAANTAASHAAHRAQAYGRWHPFLDAAPVRNHIHTLRAAGIGIEQIAALAGIATSHVRALADPGHHGRAPIRRVRPDTAQRVLSVRVQAANRAPSSRVDATGTRCRLQALSAIGWTEPQLATRLRRAPASLRRSMTSKTVTAHTAADVDALYQRLCNTRPPQTTDAEHAAANAARARAAERGWPPPLAWDDIDTDPNTDTASSPPRSRSAPAEDVDEIAVERAIAGDGIRLADLTAAEQTEAVRHLTQRGRSIRDIAEQLRTTKRTVSRRRASL